MAELLLPSPFSPSAEQEPIATFCPNGKINVHLTPKLECLSFKFLLTLLILSETIMPEPECNEEDPPSPNSSAQPVDRVSGQHTFVMPPSPEQEQSVTFSPKGKKRTFKT